VTGPLARTFNPTDAEGRRAIALPSNNLRDSVWTSWFADEITSITEPRVFGIDETMTPFLLMLALATGAVGQTTEKPATKTAAATKTADPIICETSQQIGSLIRKKRVCLHRSEWEAQRQSDRMDIQRGQVQVPVNGQ
jgi:hypothetical protein